MYSRLVYFNLSFLRLVSITFISLARPTYLLTRPTQKCDCRSILQPNARTIPGKLEVAVEWLALLLCSQNFLVSNLSMETGFPD